MKRRRRNTRAREDGSAKRNKKESASRQCTHSEPPEGQPDTQSEDTVQPGATKAANATLPIHVFELEGPRRSWTITSVEQFQSDDLHPVRQLFSEISGCQYCKQPDVQSARRLDHIKADQTAVKATEQPDAEVPAEDQTGDSHEHLVDCSARSQAQQTPSERPDEDPASLPTDIARLPEEEAESRRVQGTVTSQSARNDESEAEHNDDGDSRETETETQEDSEENDDFSHVVFEFTCVPVRDLKDKYEDIFKNLQQRGLKKVVKAWIRRSHLQKQINFPYNGGKDAKSDPDYNPSNPGKATAPDYWPDQSGWERGLGCRHREPDHICKKERLILAMHLLYAGEKYKDAQFPIDEMERSTANIIEDCPKDFHPNAELLLHYLYLARKKEILYEQGLKGPKSLVSIPVPGKLVRRIKRQRGAKPKTNMTDANNNPTEREMQSPTRTSAQPGLVSDPAPKETPGEASSSSAGLVQECLEMADTQGEHEDAGSTESGVQSPVGPSSENGDAPDRSGAGEVEEHPCPNSVSEQSVEEANPLSEREVLSTPTNEGSWFENSIRSTTEDSVVQDSQDKTGFTSIEALQSTYYDVEPTPDSRIFDTFGSDFVGDNTPDLPPIPSSLSGPNCTTLTNYGAGGRIYRDTVVSSPVINPSHSAVASLLRDPLLTERSLQPATPSLFTPAAVLQSGVHAGGYQSRSYCVGERNHGIFAAPMTNLSNEPVVMSGAQSVNMGHRERDQLQLWANRFQTTSTEYQQALQLIPTDALTASQYPQSSVSAATSFDTDDTTNPE